MSPSNDPPRDDRRPSPDALLAAASAERRGKLKIFLGAAPGVGKTYEMLRTAHAMMADHVDVVVGVVETHGRAETQAMLAGLELFPRRVVDYRGQQLLEMDLDGLLARRPTVVLVDELAHTNAPGGRHAKRYLDVEELRDAGIDVLTTLNVQHVESLNDIVARITRIRVRETVPDQVIDSADEVEVIDLTPADLIRRLGEGKVYVRDDAQRALRHYFSPGNLTALRELALRRTAQRVDDQMVNYMRSHAIAGPWAAGDRILVCISDDLATGGLVRYAKRMADRLKAPFTAIYVETARHQRLTETARDRVAESLRLAEQLGGEALTLPGRTVTEAIVGFAHGNNITQIVIGKTQRSRWFELLHGSVVHDLLRLAEGISVHVIAGEQADPDSNAARRPPMRSGKRSTWQWRPYLISSLFATAALAASMVVDDWLGMQNISLVFLMAVLGSAVLFGFLPALFTAFVSVAAYNFFFLPPLHTFTIRDPSNIWALGFFLAVALLTSRLTARVREQAEIARGRARTTAQLSAFASKLAGIGDLDDLSWACCHQIALMLTLRVVLLLPDEGGLALASAYPPDDHLSDADHAAALWAFENGKPAGRGAATLPGSSRLYLPLRTDRSVVAVVGITNDDPTAGPLLTPDERRLLDALLDQAAVAIERVRLVRAIDQAKLESETERLRSAMLTSLSHDLRTPLAAIIAAVTSLKANGGAWDGETRAALLDTLHVEAERMGRFVRNLLDMTRLEAGALELKRDAIDLADVVSGAVRRAGTILGRHRLEVDIPADLPLVLGDHLLLEQAFFNLLDNAAKYAPPGSVVRIVAGRKAAHVRLSVMDEGPGVPAEWRERIFDKFSRVQARDHQQAGTGLGLAICRGFVEAMGGTVAVRDREDGRTGACFDITLPVDPRGDLPIEDMTA
ncbi:sensor histidine kinase KdpD [Niveispirillum sp.]|uniref:sensor histidine kinase n=1 Tax=Niveispirillum sp. TaxID=1917217 RepID=UPI001B755DE9|nr:sensor histidine kinase KdpD [Niveispirillum sp.]MBP7336144.1 sensor histidine kinase KdpD [Niveispirillum sp.]